jgi:hypothetical protein
MESFDIVLDLETADVLACRIQIGVSPISRWYMAPLAVAPFNISFPSQLIASFHDPLTHSVANALCPTWEIKVWVEARLNDQQVLVFNGTYDDDAACMRTRPPMKGLH